jgi:hypothetical protein
MYHTYELFLFCWVRIVGPCWVWVRTGRIYGRFAVKQTAQPAGTKQTFLGSSLYDLACFGSFAHVLCVVILRVQLQIPFGSQSDEGGSGIQRLVDKVINEFQQNCDHVQVSALDGNGGTQILLFKLFFKGSILNVPYISFPILSTTADSFQVYQGLVRNLNTFHFANVLRHPSCFYFFSVSAIPNVASPDLVDSVMQRDICWLTGKMAFFAWAFLHG